MARAVLGRKGSFAMMTAPVTQFREKRKAVRLLWPFVRILGATPAAERMLAKQGIGPADFARPDTRLSHRLVMDLLDAWMTCTGDATIGLRAGLSVEPGELETMEYAARSCPTFREAIHCSARYMHLLNEAADVSLVEHGDVALWRFTVTDGVLQSRAANDFVLACAGKFSRRYARIDEPPLEVHFMHQAPANLTCYERFHSRALKFGMPHNGFLFSRALLDRPMVRAHAGLHVAFDSYARELSGRLRSGVRSRAREIVSDQLGSSEMCMESVAAALAMSVPTLRRRLEDEGTTFTGLVDDVRRELAERYLRDPECSISEIAFKLGFAHAPAFHKAFRRWTGVTPSEHRTRIWA
jgi:AraC-like DNA-binding protein